MKANRFTEEQIVRALKEVETGGKKVVLTPEAYQFK